MSHSASSLRELLAAGGTLVLGHRGAMATAPMNTLAAFELAQQQGAHGIELDVQLSRDGYPVVIHDHTVDATTDGAGQVSEMTLPEIKSLDAGSWFAPQFATERIPTLDEVFTAFGDTLFINVEIKSPGETTNGIEAVVADRILRHKLEDRVIVSSFDPQVLQRIRDFLPDILIGALTSPGMLDERVAAFAQLQHQARHPSHDMVDEAYMQWARKNDYYVNVWTVNEPRRALQLRSLGVNAIMTDHPDLIVSAFVS